jgi:enamine deaminase RidA (YjgF/YER057c/UK114 family)
MNRQFCMALALIAALLFSTAADKKKKDKEEELPTQTLPLIPEPPMAVSVETSRLTFDTAPLSSKGLLSRQTRDALRELLRTRRGGTIVKIRAFVAGTGDVRRVPAIVAEMFTEKHLPVPAVSTVRIGDLPLEGAQVAIESVMAAKKPANPIGVAFLAGQHGDTIDEAISGITSTVQSLGVKSGRVLKATCFFSSLADAADARARLAAAFPGAALNLVQMQRLPVEPKVNCEAVAALASAPQQAVQFVQRDGAQARAGQSQAALVSAPRVVITGLQLGFKAQDSDVRLAFDRLGKALESQHATFSDVVMARIYAMSQPIAESIGKLQFEFFNREHPPARTLLMPDSLPSIDASFGLEVIAALPR